MGILCFSVLSPSRLFPSKITTRQKREGKREGETSVRRQTRAVVKSSTHSSFMGLTDSMRHRGRYLYDVRKSFGFLDPLPLPCQVQNSSNLVPLISFLGTPHPLRMSYKYAPRTKLRSGAQTTDQDQRWNQFGGSCKYCIDCQILTWEEVSKMATLAYRVLFVKCWLSCSRICLHTQSQKYNYNGSSSQLTARYTRTHLFPIAI